MNNGEDIPSCQDFAELHALLKHADLDPKEFWIDTDEGIVGVFYGNKLIFDAEESEFVQAFFLSAGIDVDKNLSTREGREE